MIKILSYGFFILTVVSCKNNSEKIQPSISSITTSVYSSVTIQPDSLYQVFAIVNGILDKNLMDEGDLVTKGTPVMQLINSNSRLTAENAKLSYNLAQQNYSGNTAILRSIEKELNSASLKLHNDSINYSRQKNLWGQKIGSKAEYDTKKLAFEISKNAIEIARENYKRTKNQLQNQVSQSNNTYQATLINSKDYTIRSKIDGKLYALYKNPGEIVTTLEPIAVIGSANKFVVEMLVDEVDIVKIKERQKVIINLDAYGKKIFTAQVNKIYPKKDERTQTFKVEAVFDKNPETLYPGLSGEANIIISQKEKALTIPREYLIEGDKVKTESGLVTIETGLESLDRIEIISGITNETWLYKTKQ
jgi:multidrug efflux pump subunit AcrA (membrane-fusion protein)